MPLIKTFIICNKDVEKERLKNMEKQLKQTGFSSNDYEYFSDCWMDTVKQRHKNIKTNQIECLSFPMENINLAEMSLFINHIELLRKIDREYYASNNDAHYSIDNSYFLILESDAYVFPGMKFSKSNIVNLTQSIFHFKKQNENALNDFDLINLGGNCLEIFKNEGYPKDKGINVDGFKLYYEDRLICIEALLWSLKGVHNFLKQFDLYCKSKGNKITEPIDCVLDNLIRDKSKKFNIYWLIPGMIKQGSGSIWQSYLRHYKKFDKK